MKTMILAFLICAVPNAKAYLLVEDIPHLTQSIVAQIVNYAKEVESTMNQLTQITNQITQISNEVTSLARFGNPNYYVNLLGLGQLTASAANLENGIGQDIAAYRNLSNGSLALSYTANGIYSNLTGKTDRYGNAVRFDVGAFKKFAAVNSMLESYNVQQGTFNQQLSGLQQDLANTMRLLNSDRTLVGTMKYSAKVNALSAQMNILGHVTNLSGQRLAMQQASNQNDSARLQEAQVEQEEQERTTDLEREAGQFQQLIGGQP